MGPDRSADDYCAPGGGQVGDVQQFIQLRATRQPLRSRQLLAGFSAQGFEQAVELQRRLFLPVQLFQATEQLLLLVVAQAAVGQVEVQGVAGIDLCAGQAEKQAELARQAGEEPAAANIRNRPMLISGMARRGWRA